MAALELLAFVRAMQTPKGWFVNFITGWDGTKNTTGSTSADPFGPWLARACDALAAATATFGDQACAVAFERAMPWLDEPTPYLDVRAVALLAALRYHEGTGSRSAGARAHLWADELYASRCDGILPNRIDCTTVHLWGHLQECALATAGTAFNRPDWIEAARASTERLLIPAVERSFPAERSIAFDVSCVSRGLNALHRATGDTRYVQYGDLAGPWFDGRNAASAAVFDRRRGVVYDGIDGDRVSRNAGAESNIEAGLALLRKPNAASIPTPR